jgi:hypothetical protein
VTGGAWNQHCYVDELRLTVTDTSGDNVAPNPNPPTWVQAPAQSDSNSVMMVATTATDPAFVEYLFTNTVSGHASGWQDTRMWINTGLTPGVTNTYRIKTRDKSPNQNDGSGGLVRCIAYWEQGRVGTSGVKRLRQFRLGPGGQA